MNTLLMYLQPFCQGYSDYVAIHNWSGPPSANTLVLNDEKASVFSEAKFEPLPVPPKIEFTYAKFKAPWWATFRIGSKMTHWQLRSERIFNLMKTFDYIHQWQRPD